VKLVFEQQVGYEPSVDVLLFKVDMAYAFRGCGGGSGGGWSGFGGGGWGDVGGAEVEFVLLLFFHHALIIRARDV
jgi:hypothetical protein